MSMADSHNTIVLSAAPAGRFLEGKLSETNGLKPGHGMQVKATTEPVGGKHSWSAFAGTNGHRTLVSVLLENEIYGYTVSDTISNNQQIRMYCPIPGDELLVLLSASGTGTGDSQAIGDKLILANGGTFIATTGTPEMEPFIVMETMSDVVAAGTLTHVMYTGH